MDPFTFHQQMDVEKQENAPQAPPVGDFVDRSYTAWQGNPVNRKNAVTAKKRALRKWRRKQRRTE
jgi:hypothetical protein